MADIAKINAVALANIAKVDAVAAAAIAKINGLVFTAAAGAFLLDTYTGAAAAYSVRRLATSSTVLMRVRRETAGGTGDDDEADVAYDSNNILSLDSAISNASAGVTATTLGQFLNVGTVNGTTYTNPDSLTVTASCFVDEWKDQSGNSNDATQVTHASQPQIHDGTVDTDLITENGKPVITSGYIQQLSFTDSSGTDNTFTAVIKANYSQNCLISNPGGNVALGLSQSGSSQGDFGFGTPTYFVDGLSFTHTRGNMFTAAQSQILFTAVTGDPARTTLNTGYATAITYYSYNMQELIQWPVDQTSPTNNRTGIETNINDYFDIYT